MTVDVDVSGMEDLKKNLRWLSSKLVEDAVEEAKRLAEYLKAESQRQVPYKSGNLHDSAFIHEDDDPTFKGWSVGYDAATVQYAWYVHEIEAAHYTKPGTKHHFLSDPAAELAAEFPDLMRQKLSRTIANLPATRFAPSTGPRLIKKAKI